jgi:hypothetical protein
MRFLSLFKKVTSNVPPENLEFHINYKTFLKDMYTHLFIIKKDLTRENYRDLRKFVRNSIKQFNSLDLKDPSYLLMASSTTYFTTKYFCHHLNWRFASNYVTLMAHVQLGCGKIDTKVSQYRLPKTFSGLKHLEEELSKVKICTR